MNNNIKELKSFINRKIKQVHHKNYNKLKNNDIPALNFRVKEFGDQLQYGGQIGHIQYNTTLGRASWDVFYNGKCVYSSYTLISAVKKLDRLGISFSDFEHQRKLERDVYFEINELTEDELEELKERYEDKNELYNISLNEVKEHYKGTQFVEEDFFCNV